MGDIMINIKHMDYTTYSVSYSVFIENEYVGCIVVSRYVHDLYISACYAKTMSVALDCNTLIDAIKWLKSQNDSIMELFN